MSLTEVFDENMFKHQRRGQLFFIAHFHSSVHGGKQFYFEERLGQLTPTRSNESTERQPVLVGLEQWSVRVFCLQDCS